MFGDSRFCHTSVTMSMTELDQSAPIGAPIRQVPARRR